MEGGTQEGGSLSIHYMNPLPNFHRFLYEELHVDSLDCIPWSSAAMSRSSTHERLSVCWSNLGRLKLQKASMLATFGSAHKQHGCAISSIYEIRVHISTPLPLFLSPTPTIHV